jgi:asparagine synthetase B (glutamine-hydrolysing)
MAKIAALIVPARRVDALESLCKTARELLCLYSGHLVEMDTYRGQRAACTLLRVKPDPLNRQTQPVLAATSACVACGYYLSTTKMCESDSATRLATDLASEDGVAALARGDGVYAFARWDKDREQLCAGVDKLGMRPLYWAALPEGGYAVASELKVLVRLQDALEINWAAWEEFLAFGNVFGAHTFFRGIQRISSQTVERFLENIDVRERPLEEFVEQQTAAFDTAMARLASLHGERENAMLTLSGGYDSRRILGGLLNRGIRPEVYTVPEVLSDGGEYESAIVRELCQLTGLDGYSVYPRNSDDRTSVREIRDLAIDFEAGSHNYSTILAMALDCQDRVNYDGLAGDIALSGLFMVPAYFQTGGDEAFIANWPNSARQWLRLPATGDQPLHERLRNELDRWEGHPNRFAYFYLMGRTRRQVSLAPLLLQANVFESLCPYLDREVMRSAFGFPPAHMVGAHMQPRLIKALNPLLGDARTAYTIQTKLHKVSGVEQRSERSALLRKVAGLSPIGQEWSVASKQRWRFRLAGALPLADDRQRWEFDKATTLARLAHFGRVTRSPTDYGDATMDLKAAYGNHRDWCQPL